MTVRPAVLERLFHLREAGTTIRTELIAGATTFATLSYITFVQPAVLAGAGMDFGVVMAATCVASGFATALSAYLLSAYFRRWNSVRLALPGGARGASRFQ